MNSRGVIGTTMTWIVATILIVVILAVSFLIMSALAIFDNKSEVSMLKKVPDVDAGKTRDVIHLIDYYYDDISEWADYEGPVGEYTGNHPDIGKYIAERNLDLDVTIIFDNEAYYESSYDLPSKNLERFKILTKGGNFVDVYYR